jgi:hypothetical protein
MKGGIIAVIAVLMLAVVGIVGLPVLIDRHITGLKQDVQDVKQRLQKIEDESQVAPLEPSADTQKIIKTVNALALQVDSNQNSIRKDIVLQNETIQKQKAATDEAFKKQMDAIERNHADMQSQIHITRFNVAVEDIRQHILKARMEIIAKNLGNAKTEVDFIDDLFATLSPSAKEEQKTLIDEMRALLKKAKVEIDTDLPSFINRMNSVWHESGKLLR